MGSSTRRQSWTERLRPLAPVAVLLAAQVVALLSLRAVYPRFFYIDDKVAQYIPAFREIGLQLRSGQLPALNNPGLGMAGNFSADLQYGVRDPAHWLIAIIVSSFEDLNAAGWFLNVLSTVIIGLGILTLLRIYGSTGALAVSAAAAASMSGCLLWIGAAWWPMTWAVGWLVWLWVGLAITGWRGALVTGAASWLLVGAGYPYALPFAFLLVTARVVEEIRLRGSRGLWRSDLVLRLGAGAAGAVASLPGLLMALIAQPFSQRSGGVFAGPVGNTGYFIPNFLDVLLPSPTLLPIVRLYDPSSDLALVPLTMTAVFAVPLLPLIVWRGWGRRPGDLIAVTMVVAALIATQLPEQVLSFRYSVRHLALTGVLIPVFVLLAARGGLVVTRRRTLLAVASVAGAGLLAFLRTPTLADYHVLAAITTFLALAAILVIAAGSARLQRVVAASVLIAAAATAPAFGAWASTAADRRVSISQGAEARDQPAIPFDPLRSWGTQVQEYAARSPLVGQEQTTVYRWLPGSARGWDVLALQGNA
ncbi:MAG: hypothetical protein ABWZ77_06225, partial [Naasia sp.]